MLRVFVYGTLLRGHRNHEHYCHGLVAAKSATVRGRLYDLPQGYPMLVMPGEPLAIGTRDAAADLASQIECSAASLTLDSTAADPADDPWQPIHGEVLSFDDAEHRLSMLDELEDFHPGGPSLYVRVLVRTEQGDVVWTYVAPDGRLPPGAKQIAGRWKP